ncbi:YdcF family protein [Roseibacterium beibuensis]|uniref:DUF218 domain-containing protein n=1 Tax=[Roseibacterium] beibuensis TaxID=1193142 RepID=A0ABP9L5H4_9RHOB|nr:YdcF family protein [Roseibacterium beibuensis]MCS6621341.1 YdcF family protein [Roseibacterium beibuensis]
MRGRGIRRAGRTLRAVLLVWAATFAAVCLWTVFWPDQGLSAEGDAILCLSSGVQEDGTADSGSRIRAETCAELYRAGAAPLVVFSGGGFPVTAADAMAEVAALPADVVRIEPQAASTLQNIYYASDLIAEGSHVLLVTEAYHLPRSWASARVMGMDNVTLVPAARLQNEPRLWSLTRESLAIWFNLARFAAYGLGGWLGMPDETRIAWLT